MFYFDPLYWIIMLPIFVLGMLARTWVNRTYQKWSQVQNSGSITGGEAAQRLIQSNNLYQVNLEGVAGTLTDHYDPRNKTLRLSSTVRDVPSVASIAIAAHELGHAQQDAQAYGLLRFRTAIVPFVNIGTNLGSIAIFAGLILGGLGSQSWIEIGNTIAWIGLAGFSLGAIFSMATLPLELNASARARAMLKSSGLLQTPEDRSGVNAVLNAAAFTYLAALVAMLGQLLYYAILIFGRGSRRRN